MAISGQIRTLIISGAIVVLGIIHLCVGIAIFAKYRQFHDIFEQQVGLSGYNTFIAFNAIMIGIAGFFAVLRDYPRLIKIVAIASFVFSICTLASLIAALALTGQAVSHISDSITDNMNSYVSDDESISIIDNLQTKYECCGVNLWLDWSRVQLNPSSTIANGRRRRQNLPPPQSPLVRALRQKRQTVKVDDTGYNLPTSYSIYLPLSCCKSGGTSSGNSLGGYCVVDSANGTTSFYVSGCLRPVGDIACSQLGGIIVINTCLTTLFFVYFAILITIFMEDENAIEEHKKETYQNQDYQFQLYGIQYPYDQTYANNYNLNLYDYNNHNFYYDNNVQSYGYYL